MFQYNCINFIFNMLSDFELCKTLLPSSFVSKKVIAELGPCACAAYCRLLDFCNLELGTNASYTQC